MKRLNSENIKLAAEIAVVIISVVALLVSLQSNRTAQKANEIAERANGIAEAQITPSLSIESVVVSEISYVGGDGHTGACRHRIRIANTGGVDTTLTSISAILAYDNTTDNIPYISDVDSIKPIKNTGMIVTQIAWSADPPAFDKIGVSEENGKRLPLVIPNHSTKDLFVDVVVKDEKKLYKLTTLSDINSSTPSKPLSFQYTLVFPDFSPAVTPMLDCVAIHQT